MASWPNIVREAFVHRGELNMLPNVARSISVMIVVAIIVDRSISEAFSKCCSFRVFFHPALGSSCDLVQGLCLSLILISRPDSGFGAIVRLNNSLWVAVGTSVWFSLQSQTDRVALPLWNIIPVVKKMDQQECFFLNNLSKDHQIVVILVMSTHCDGFSEWKSDNSVIWLILNIFFAQWNITYWSAGK